MLHLAEVGRGLACDFEHPDMIPTPANPYGFYTIVTLDDLFELVLRNKDAVD